MIKTYTGWLHDDSFGFLCIGDTPLEDDGPRLAEQIQNDWETGGNVFLRYYITTEKVTLDEAIESLLKKTFGGDLEVEYTLCAYSEWTVEEWKEELKIGGHNLIEELDTYRGKYVVIVIESQN